LNISEIVNSKSAIYLNTNHFHEDEIVLIKNSPEEIKQLAIEAAKRQKKEWKDCEGDKLQEKFRKIFLRKKTLEANKYQGEIKGRIGVDFLKKNQWWLN
jgi:inactivated superfamily I helicase